MEMINNIKVRRNSNIIKRRKNKMSVMFIRGEINLKCVCFSVVVVIVFVLFYVSYRLSVGIEMTEYEINRIQSEINEINNKQKEKEVEVKKVQQLNDKLFLMNGDLQKRNSNLKDEINLKQELITSHKNNINKYKKDVLSLEDDLLFANKSYKEIDNAIAKRQEEIIKLTKKNNKLNQEIFWRDTC